MSRWSAKKRQQNPACLKSHNQLVLRTGAGNTIAVDAIDVKWALFERREDVIGLVIRQRSQSLVRLFGLLTFRPQRDCPGAVTTQRLQKSEYIVP